MKRRISAGPKASRKKKEVVVEIPKVHIPFRVDDVVEVRTDAVSQKTQKPLDGRKGRVWSIKDHNEIQVKLHSAGLLRKEWVPTEILPFALSELRASTLNN